MSVVEEEMSAAEESTLLLLNLNEKSDPAIALDPEREIVLHYTKGFFSRNGLFKWVDGFELGTAGYRDTFNMEDFFSTDAPFNAHTVMILAEAMARIYTRRGYRSFHIGGEVRRYTAQIIEYVSRILAAHSISVHLHADMQTTPIWASSFGVFFNELDGGANVTASHSQSFKQGIKPMDEKGMQLLELADEIRDEVRQIGREVAERDVTVRLSRRDSPLVRRDFHYMEAYENYMRQIIPGEAFELIRKAQEAGMKVGVSTVGGSMHENSAPIFEHFGIDVGPSGTIRYMHAEKRDDFHRVGLINGEDFGCDPTKAIIYRNIGLKERLLAGEIHFGFIWDPDGDRYNIVTVADSSLAEEASNMGLEVEKVEGRPQVVVYFKPNQIYFLIAALKLEMLVRSGELFDFDWVIGTTYPTSRSIGELADVFNRKFAPHFQGQGTRVRVFNTPVGFKYFGSMVGEIEERLRRGGEVVLTDATGMEVSLGQKPRILIMAEESGGAAMGSLDWSPSRHGRRQSLALKEKDGMQLALMNLSVMAMLHLEKSSFARLYMDKIREYDIVYRYYDRIDKKLFEESLIGTERERAQAVGNKAKEYMVETFRSFVGKRDTDEVRGELQALVGEAVKIPEIKRVFWAGDGTFIDFGSFWFELRASGTDAVLRFYIEGKDKLFLNKINQALVAIAERKIKELKG
jgi:phosphomannomutase